MPVPEETRARCAAHVGRVRETRDAMAPEPARRLQALLDLDVTLREGDALPPAWHWVYLAETVPQADLGADGHERLGLFLPPAPFARRMWAAGDIAIHAPLTLGTPALRRSTVVSVVFKTGRTGELCFVEVRHEIEQGGEPRLVETQTIVYRERGLPETALRSPDDPVPEGWRVHADLQLFGYSALTHNAHRIHWDRDHCREVEGYPGLVVHGPLLATRLAEALRATRPEPPVRFAFRARAPVFETTPIRVEIDPRARGEARLLRSDGREAMSASMAWS